MGILGSFSSPCPLYTHQVDIPWVFLALFLLYTHSMPTRSIFCGYPWLFFFPIPTKSIFCGYSWLFFFPMPTLCQPGRYSVGILGSFSSPYPPGRYSLGILGSFSSPYPLHTHQVDILWVFLTLFLPYTHSMPTRSIFCGYGGQLCITIPAHSPLARSVVLSLPHTHIPFHLYFSMPGNLHCDSSIILSAEIMGTAGCQAFQCFRVRMSIRIISSSRKQSYLRLQ